MLGPTVAVVDAASESLKMHVDTLCGRDVKWAAIGKALGVTRQAAWERFSQVRIAFASAAVEQAQRSIAFLRHAINVTRLGVSKVR